jgi:hypothetical protein
MISTIRVTALGALTAEPEIILRRITDSPKAMRQRQLG